MVDSCKAQSKKATPPHDGETGSPKIRKQVRAITIAKNQSAKSIPCKEHRRCLSRPVEIDSMIARSTIEIQISGCAGELRILDKQ
jgi:hypothetical protein